MKKEKLFVLTMIDKEGSSGDFTKDLQNKNLKVRQVSFSVKDVNFFIKRRKDRDRLAAHLFHTMFQEEIMAIDKERGRVLQKKIKEAKNR